MHTHTQTHSYKHRPSRTRGNKSCCLLFRRVCNYNQMFSAYEPHVCVRACVRALMWWGCVCFCLCTQQCVWGCLCAKAVDGELEVPFFERDLLDQSRSYHCVCVCVLFNTTLPFTCSFYISNYLHVSYTSWPTLSLSPPSSLP